MLRKDGELAPASLEEALDAAVERLGAIQQESGAASIAFFGSPFITNEENFLVGRIARDVEIGRAHV